MSPKHDPHPTEKTMRSMGQRKSDPGSLAFSRGPVQGVHNQQGFGGREGVWGAKRATKGGQGGVI